MGMTENSVGDYLHQVGIQDLKIQLTVILTGKLTVIRSQDPGSRCHEYHLMVYHTPHPLSFLQSLDFLLSATENY